jgi:hypothetical protein
MSNKTQELYAAALAVLPCLRASTDDLKLSDLEYLKKGRPPAGETPAQRLRREADEIEQRDAVIKRFRDAVAAFGDGGN